MNNEITNVIKIVMFLPAASFVGFLLDQRKLVGRGRLRKRDLTFAYSQNIDFPESFILPFFTKKLALLSVVREEVTRSLDRKVIKLPTFDNLFPPLRRRVTRATTFSRQNDVDSRASTTKY